MTFEVWKWNLENMTTRRTEMGNVSRAMYQTRCSVKAMTPREREEFFEELATLRDKTMDRKPRKKAIPKPKPMPIQPPPPISSAFSPGTETGPNPDASSKPS